MSTCLMFVMDRFDTNYDTSMFEAASFYNATYDIRPNREKRTNRVAESFAKDNYKPDGDEKILEGAYLRGGVIHGPAPESPNIVLLGDSHALMWAKIIDEINEEQGSTIAINAIAGADPFFSIPLDPNPTENRRYTSEQRFAYNRAIYEALDRWRPDVVIISTRWSNRNFEDAHDLIQYIGNLNVPILLIDQPPSLYFKDQSPRQFLAYLGLDPSSSERQYVMAGGMHRYNRGRKMVNDLVNMYDHVHLVKTSDIYFDAAEENVWVLDGETILYWDDDHLSYEGTMRSRPRLTRSITTFLEESSSSLIGVN